MRALSGHGPEIIRIEACSRALVGGLLGFPLMAFAGRAVVKFLGLLHGGPPPWLNDSSERTAFRGLYVRCVDHRSTLLNEKARRPALGRTAGVVGGLA
jgi:hypothetical protein